ncbi:MAG TPA: tetratricopeptide repeat protein, partial [Polyangia bacterium]|nr:tetratricopeptide repeat protein [Polyangia bacterium]
VVVPLDPPAPVAVEVPVVPAPPRPRHAPPAERRVAEAPTTEAQLLGRALSLLRQDHDARGALKLLDQYASAYPRGVLASEALTARLEAVIQLDDRAAALRLLDDRSAFAGRLGAEQLLTRAELRASAGRYADALVDFDRLLGPAAGAATPATADRALYGRAVCLGHLGRDDRARADLEAYRKRYPAGRYAAEVSRLLGGAARRQ